MCHLANSLDAQGCGSIAEAQKIGTDIPGKIPGKQGIGFAAGKDPDKNRAKKSGQLIRDAAIFHQFSNTTPEAQGPGHGHCQGNPGLGTFRYGGCQRASVSAQQCAQAGQTRENTENP